MEMFSFFNIPFCFITCRMRLLLQMTLTSSRQVFTTVNSISSVNEISPSENILIAFNN